MNSKVKSIHLDYVRDVYVQISEYDLELHAPQALNSDTQLQQTLYALGMDVSSNFCETLHCIHRTLSRIEPYEGRLFIGPERVDEEWLNSGQASFDVQVEIVGDMSLKHELDRIKTTSSNLMCKDVETHSAKCGYYSAATDGENYVK